MELSKELNELVQKHLGKQALSIQQKSGRGLWIAHSGDQASYVLLKDVSKMFKFGSADEMQDVIDAINEADINSQVVVWFDTGEEATNFAAVVDIE
jgi:hypothetical protein